MEPNRLRQRPKNHCGRPQVLLQRPQTDRSGPSILRQGLRQHLCPTVHRRPYRNLLYRPLREPWPLQRPPGSEAEQCLGIRQRGHKSCRCTTNPTAYGSDISSNLSHQVLPWHRTHPHPPEEVRSPLGQELDVHRPRSQISHDPK